MLFNSLEFLAFFVIMFFLYYQVVPDKYRWALLLIGSMYFYMSYVPKYILILLFLITVDYVLGIQIYAATGKRRLVFLWVSIIANIGTLLFFKYFNFFNENVAYLAHAIHWNYSPLILQIALPLGLSFHVFQSLSYVIEIYRGKQVPERHFGVYALYVLFFPQLVAGPIERPGHMIHQFHEPHRFDALNVRHGLELMLWGFFKKLFIADRLGRIVDHVYGNLDGSSGWTVLFAAILFAYQLYCDFSGYSDIAVGAALVFGYDLTRNFNRPYASRSISEFWRRWHMSLSSWLRDYLYYPLVFLRKKAPPTYIHVSLFITFTLIGLWHGANWTFVVFGALQGVYIIISTLSVEVRKKVAETIGLARLPGLWHAWQVVVTFLAFVVSLVFFRAENVSQALAIFGRIGSAIAHPTVGWSGWSNFLSFGNLAVGMAVLATIIAGILVVEWVQYMQAQKGTLYILDGRSRAVRWGVYYALIFSTLLLGYLAAQPFVYFKF